MKPGRGGIQSEQTSLVVQVNPNANIYGAPGRGPLPAATALPPRSQARHKLPMSPTGPRILPARNISALARPLPKLMASPKKKTDEDDFEGGIVERRPKIYKHLPINYQVATNVYLQDHNYCALPPSPTTLVSPKPSLQPCHLNGLSLLPNGISRQQPPPATLTPPVPFFRSGYTRGVTPEPVRNPPSLVPDRAAEESDLSSDGEAVAGNTEDGEETETAPEDEDSVTRCICEFQHDDGYMICCDKCLVWQHVDCMGIERGNIPEEYRCEECEPRKVDKARAIRLQIAKKSQFNDSSDSHESLAPNTPPKAGRTSTGSSGGTARKGSNAGRGVARRRERGGKAGRWRVNSESKRGKYSKPTAKQKQKKTATKKVRESLSEKKDTSGSSGGELTSPSPSEGIHQLRQWIDSYEEAVTNHYSPELRARISVIKVNGLHSELRLTASVTPTSKSKISLLPSGLKILITTAYIPANQAIIEVRGKYMLSKGGTPTSGNNNKQQYVFHHRINGPGPEVTEVQVDATTYGNDARFIRSSCSPNAEIRHCIEKGTLHLYVVSTTAIDAKSEITIPHRPGLGLCASGEKCTLLSSNNNDKRRRGRRRTLSESSTSTKSSSISLNNNNIKVENIINNIKETPINKRPPPPPISPEPPVIPPKVTKVTPNSAPSPPLTRESSSKATRGQVSSRRATTPAAKTEERKRNPASSPTGKKIDGKLTREERKMEAYIKAFERLEKDEQRKQNTTGPGVGRVRKSSTSLSPVREKQEKPQLKKTGSGRGIVREGRTGKSLRPRRSSKLPTTVPRRVSRRRAPSEGTESDESEGASIGGSGPPTPGTPPLPEIPVYEASTPAKDEEPTGQEQLNNSSGSESTPPPNVSNACLLVAAAVGPLAPGFKFPKTKKNLLNTWFGGGEVLQHDEAVQKPGLTPVDCAKKRWLRQAISEDSDSPKHETGGIASPTEMAAPLKKRRFARESISSELSYTPPETPQAETQAQIYEYDENSMEPQGSSSEGHPQNELQPQPEVELQAIAGGGPRTPPPCSNTADSTPVSTPNETPPKLPSPTTEITEEEKSTASAKAKEVARVKRKLSISEYRERVKSNPGKGGGSGEMSQPSQPTPVTPNPLSGIDEIDTDSEDFLSNSILFSVPPPPIETAFKKGSTAAGFNAAPTLVEQQREALTERLRREFGLLLSDDEEEKKKGITGQEGPTPANPQLPELKKKRKPPPPPPPPPLPPVAPPPPPPPPTTNEWMYYQHTPQYRFTRTF